MIVYVAYHRNTPWLLQVFRTRTKAAAFVNARPGWRQHYTIHRRAVQ